MGLYCSKKCQRNNKFQKQWPTGCHQPSKMNGRWGAAGELIAAADLLSKGFYPYTPKDAHSPFDLIALGESGKLYKVEVKRGRVSMNGAMVAIGQVKNPVDLIAVVVDKDVTYFKYSKSTTLLFKRAIDLHAELEE